MQQLAPQRNKMWTGAQLSTNKAPNPKSYFGSHRPAEFESTDVGVKPTGQRSIYVVNKNLVLGIVKGTSEIIINFGFDQLDTFFKQL